MEERVTKSEERISRLNMVIFKWLSEKRNLKKKIMVFMSSCNGSC